MLGTLDDERPDDLLVVRYPYFEHAEPMVFDAGGTYVSTDAVFAHNVTHQWNHGLGEIITALLSAGLTVTGLAEHDSVPGRPCQGRWRSSATANGGSRRTPPVFRTPTPSRPGRLCNTTINMLTG